MHDFPNTMDMTVTARAPKKHTPSAIAPTPIILPTADQVLAVARHPHDLADGFRTMQNILGLSNAWLDNAGDFGEETIGKYLGPSHAKTIGPFYFQMLCSLLAVEWRMHVDLERATEMMKVWEQRKPQYVQPLSRAPSRDIIERARPHVLNEYLSELGRKGARARWSKQRIKKQAAQ